MRTTSWMQPVKLCLGAVALGVSAWATAQVAPAPAAAEMGAAPMAHTHGAKHDHPKAHQHPHKKGAKHHHHHGHKHGAAHGKRPHHEGRGHAMPTDAGLNQYERNALQRCAVFKEGVDRRACVERVRHGTVSGSVAGGGTITEYTYQVHVPQ